MYSCAPRLAGELRLVGAARDSDGAEAHARRVLDREVTEAADALHRDGLTRARAAVAQRVERGHTGAQQRAGVDGREALGDPRDGRLRHHDVLGVAAVVADARDLGILAVDELTAAARIALEAVPAMPAHAHAIAGLPRRDLVANGIDAPRDLVTGNPREFDAGIGTGLDEHVAVAHAAGLDLDPDPAARRRGDVSLDDLEGSIGSADLDGFHAVTVGLSVAGNKRSHLHFESGAPTGPRVR